MARSNKQDVKKQRTWKFYTILSSIIGVLIIALVVGLIVTYNSIYSEDYENIFSEYTDYKKNQNEFETMFDEENIDKCGRYTIVFAYDESYMTQSKIDELDEDNVNRDSYIKANKEIANLWESIGTNHSKYEEGDNQSRVDMYFINVSLIGNKDFLSSEYVGGTDDSSKEAPAIFILDSEGKYVSEAEYGDIKLTLKSSGSYSELAYDLRSVKDLVEYFNQLTSE